MISKPKLRTERAIRKWLNGSTATAKRKGRKRSNAGARKWKWTASTTNRKSAISSARRPENSGSIQQRPRRSSGWNWTTKSPTGRQRHSAQKLLSILRLDDRRGNVFGRPHVDATAQLTVAHAVAEVDQQSNREPDKEAAPCFQRQTQHQYGAKDYTENREQRNHRNTKWAGPIGLFAP